MPLHETFYFEGKSQIKKMIVLQINVKQFFTIVVVKFCSLFNDRKTEAQNNMLKYGKCKATNNYPLKSWLEVL